MCAYRLDEEFGTRLLISLDADRTELPDNIRCARTLLRAFPEMQVVILRNTYRFHVKNPEYLIDGQIGDRKGIHSEKGITNAFKKAARQGCRVVVLDLDKHMKSKLLHPGQIAKHIVWRPDFSADIIHTCYVVYRGKAVAVSCGDKDRDSIMAVLEGLKAGPESPTSYKNDTTA